jgi:hypothetical protein
MRCISTSALLLLLTTQSLSKPLNEGDIRLYQKANETMNTSDKTFNIGSKTNDQIILDINQAMIDFWSADSKKGQWPKYATKVDSVLEDNTVIETVGEVEYTDCVTTKKKLSTLT